MRVLLQVLLPALQVGDGQLFLARTEKMMHTALNTLATRTSTMSHGAPTESAQCPTISHNFFCILVYEKPRMAGIRTCFVLVHCPRRVLWNTASILGQLKS